VVKTVAPRSVLRRWWQRARRRLGWTGLLGVLLLLLAVGGLAVWPELQQASDAAKAELESRRDSLRRPQAPPPEPPTAQQQLDRLVDGFPTFEQNASDVKAVFAGAQRAQVNLLKGEYVVKADAGSPFITYTATFPVQEGYGSLKLFAADVLQTLPHAALDEMRMARPNTGSTMLDATIRFTLVYRRP
jgi:hypothetical protein